MIVIKSAEELHELISDLKKDGKRIGFTPTMGALHTGHMALIEQSNEICDISVCSIFVNPTQFNEASDLEKYPRTLEADEELLVSHECDILFFPSVDVMYPDDLDTELNLDFGLLDKTMEGEFRPGHFEGVAQVVSRLLDIIVPDALFMGQKDFQQVAIVQFMIDKVGHNTELVMCETVREEDGLAKSSRNVRLTEEVRRQAHVIFRVLSWSKEQVGHRTIEETKKIALENLSIPNFRPEYFSIADAKTLQPIKDWKDSEFIVACTAVWGGEVRLIDNTILKGGGK